MKERPVIFSGPMVRAILGGSKTQTRRVLKIRPPYVMDERDDGRPWPWATTWAPGDTDDGWMPCPYGVPGDRLYCKETWGQADSRQDEWSYHRGKPDASLPVLYRADDPTGGADDEYWRPSIFMPRWASRIDLRVTDVRVERVQEITEEDARAEGVAPFPLDPEGDCWTDGTHRTAFEYLWGKINGWPGERRARAPWESNPWVWVIGFEVESVKGKGS